MVARPGVSVAVIVILSVLATHALRESPALLRPWTWMLAAGLLAASSLVVRRTPWSVTLLVPALVMFVIGWTSARSLIPSASHLSRMLIEGERVVVLEGVALTEPRPTPRMIRGLLSPFDHRPSVPMFVFDARRLVTAPDGALPSLQAERYVSAPGRFWAHLSHADARLITPGMALRVSGIASCVRAPTNPGERDYRPIALEEHFAGHLEIPSPQLITPIAHRATLDRLRARWASWREAARARSSDALLPERDASPGRALLAALLLGERDAAIRPLRSSFTRLGLTHLLAISGLNIVVLAGTLALMLRVLLVALRAPLIIAWRLEPALVSLGVIVYLIVLPVEPSILRAGIMTLALLLPPAFGRRHDRVNTLAWTLVLLLLAWPYELFSLGLQLSFGIVLALLTLATPLQDRWFGRPADPDTLSLLGRALRRLQTAFVAAVVAWAVSVPCIALHTGMITPLAVPATLLAAAPVSLLSALGYVALLLSLIAPGASEFLLRSVIASAEHLAHLATMTDAIPHAVIRVPRLSPWLAASATALIVAWLLVPRDPLARRSRAARVVLAVATTLVGAWSVAELRAPILRSDVALRIDALDVGDGSCLLLRAGQAAALWDAGGSSFDLGVLELPGALRALGARRIHDIFVTHANLDHYNALPDLLNALPVKRLHLTRHFLRAAEQHPEGPEAMTLRHARSHAIEVHTRAAGDAIALGPARLRVLWPPPDLSLDTPDNDASLVVRLEHPDLPPGSGALLTGDIQARAMRALLTDAPSLRAGALELPHHGSAASMPTSIDFVHAVNPDVVLQSSGPSRLNDDRWDAARSPGAHWLVTARSGALWCEWLFDGSIRSGALHPP